MVFKRLSLFVCVLLALSLVIPTLAQDEGSLADVIPADASIYVNFQTDDIFATAEYLLDDLGIEGNPISFDLLQIFANQGLSVTSAEPPTLDDLLGWLGSEIVIAANAEVESVMMGELPNVAVVSRVDDDAGFAAYVDSVLQNPMLQDIPYEKGKVDVGNTTLTTYTTMIPVEGFEVQVQAALWEGYFAFGTPGFIAEVATLSQEGSANALSQDASFQMVMSGITTDPIMSIYVSDRALREALLGVNMVAPDTVPPAFVGLIESYTGIAFAIGGNEDEWAIQYTEHVDLDELGAVFPDLPDMSYVPNSEGAAAFLPGRTIAANLFGDLNGFYLYVIDLAKAIAPAFDWTADEVDAEVTDFESEFEEESGLSWRKDILSWMTSSYGQAVFYNPDSVLACEFDGIGLDFGGGIVTSDPDFTDDFLARFAAAVEAEGVTVSELPDGLYTFAEGSVVIVAGRIEDVVIGTTKSGLAFMQAAMSGEASLADNPVWQRAMSLIPAGEPYPILFVNLLEARSALEQVRDSGFVQSEGDLQDLNTVISVLKPFESALIYASHTPDGNFTLTASITTARPDVTALAPLPASQTVCD